MCKMKEFGDVKGLQWPEQLITMIVIVMMMILILSDRQNVGLHPLYFAHWEIVH